MNLDDFLKQISPTIGFFPQTGWNYCHGCGKSMDSTEKLLHYKICSHSEDKKTQKLRQKIISDNFPDGFQQNKPVAEVPLSWYRKSINTTNSLSIDFKPTGSQIDETIYPSTRGRQLSSKDVKDLSDLFSGKVKCHVRQVYTKNPIIDSIPMALEFEQARNEREGESEDYVKGRGLSSFNILNLIKSQVIENERYYIIPVEPAVGVLYVTKKNPTFISGQLRMRSNGGGRYPSRYLEMIETLFGPCENTIEVCSNSVSNYGDKDTIEKCFTVDINENYQPSLVDDCQTLDKIASNRFDRYRADPPYNEKTAREMYGTGLPDIGKLLKSACRVVRDGSLIILLLGNVNRQSVPFGLKRIGLIPISCVPSNELRSIHLYYKLENDACAVSNPEFVSAENVQEEVK